MRNVGFRTPQVLYFYLPSGIEAASVREIGKLALFSLLSAAIFMEKTEGRRNQVFLFIDEFQQIVSSNLEIILRQARSKNIAAILANQTISDLKTASADLVPTVRANTRLKQVFASTDLQQQNDIITASGEGFGGFQATEDVIDDLVAEMFFEPPQEEFAAADRGDWASDVRPTPRITRNDIIHATDDNSLSIIQLSRGGGYAQFSGFPFILKSEYHTNEQTYEERTESPWPTDDRETLTVTQDDLPRARDAFGPPAQKKPTVEDSPREIAAPSPQESEHDPHPIAAGLQAIARDQEQRLDEQRGRATKP